MADSNQSNGADTAGQKTRSNRGFAAMDPRRQREIASEGGRAAHQRGTAHEFTSQEAREAGRKGGLARAESKGRGTPLASDDGTESSEGSTPAVEAGVDRFDRALGGEPGIER